MTTGSTIRLGKPPTSSRMSSLRRRTMTASRSFRPRTLTPRVNRCGSSSSSRVEKLLEWPLWGVAERKRRCSKRSHRSRTARVNLDSIPYRPPWLGAAWCASSRTRRLPGRIAPSHARMGSA